MPENKRMGTPDSRSSGKRWTEGFVEAQKESLTWPLHSTHAFVFADAWKASTTSLRCINRSAQLHTLAAQTYR